MTHSHLAGFAGLAFGIATLVATCGNGGQGGRARDGIGPDGVGQDPAIANAPPPPDAIHLLISGSMQGRLEPCGCASGQLGGLARRMQHIGEQRSYDLLLEGGDLVGGNSELDELKLLTAATVLFGMERAYDALGVGARDLTMAFDTWSAFLAAAPIVATNLDSDREDWPGQPFLDKQVRDQHVRIASLLLDELPEAADGAAQVVRRTDPIAAWRTAFADADPDTLRIVMLHGGEPEIRALLPQLAPQPDLAIGVDRGFLEPSSAPAMVGAVPLVFTGIRGRVLLDARLWRDGDTPRVACETVPLAASKTLPGGGGDPQVRDVLLVHRHDVESEGVLAKMAEREPAPGDGGYVGTATCRGCHQTAYDAWAKSKHAHAWQTLVDAENDPERYGWPVTAYPDCVDCHVVGYGEKTGFVTYADTPQLADVGCERCHGPGSQHVLTGGQHRLGIIGDEKASVMCTQCHDFEQSPDFVYSDRWAVIEHGREAGQQKR